MEFFSPKLWSILDLSVECIIGFRAICSFHKGYFGLVCGLHSKSFGVPNVRSTAFECICGSVAFPSVVVMDVSFFGPPTFFPFPFVRKSLVGQYRPSAARASINLSIPPFAVTVKAVRFSLTLPARRHPHCTPRAQCLNLQCGCRHFILRRPIHCDISSLTNRISEKP